jgi:hypothetical protein
MQTDDWFHDVLEALICCTSAPPEAATTSTTFAIQIAASPKLPVDGLNGFPSV